MFLLLLLSVIAASLNSTLLHKVKLKGNGAIYLFNLLTSAMWCICLFISNGGRPYIDASVCLWGCIYGVTQTLFILFKAAAMNSGPVSVTTLMGNCSMLVSVFACFFIWDESVSPADIVGLVLLMSGVILMTFKASGGRLTKKWFFSSVCFLVCGAGVGIIFKAFAKSGTSHAGDMMFVSAVVMLVSYTLICAFCGSFGLVSQKTEKKREFIIIALISGLFSCLYNRMNIYISGVLDGVIFFPSFNGGVVVLSVIFSILFLRERLTSRQILGIVTGLVGICVIGIL